MNENDYWLWTLLRVIRQMSWPILVGLFGAVLSRPAAELLHSLGYTLTPENEVVVLCSAILCGCVLGTAVAAQRALERYPKQFIE